MQQIVESKATASKPFVDLHQCERVHDSGNVARSVVILQQRNSIAIYSRIDPDRFTVEEAESI